MKGITKFINEHIDDSTVLVILEANGFSQFVSVWDNIIGDNSPAKKFATNILDLNKNMHDEYNVTAYINSVLTSLTDIPEETFIYNPELGYIKMFPTFNTSLKEIAEQPGFKNYISIEDTKNSGDYSISVYVQPDKGRRKKIIQTGSGSIGRVNTSSLELATCKVWNAYIEQLELNPEFEGFGKEEIMALIKDLSEDFNSEWVSSFQKQILAIKSFLETINEEPTEYRLCRYAQKDSIVGMAYANLIDNYTITFTDSDGISKLKKSLKDNFDPSDVMVYKLKNENFIAQTLNKLAGQIGEGADKVKEEFINLLFMTHEIMGISLKKISSAKESAEYNLFNIGNNNRKRIGNVEKFEYHKTKNNVQIECTGKFDFNGMRITEPGEDEKIMPGTDKIKLTLRTFGGGTVALDALIMSGKQPALGKCPAREWRSLLNIRTKNPSIIESCEKLMEFLNDNSKDKVKKELTTLISAAAKEGPACFPFVLLH